MKGTAALLSDALGVLTETIASRTFVLLFMPALAIACGLIGYHIWLEHVVRSPEFSGGHEANIGRDRGYGERYEYVLEALAIAAMLAEYLRTRGFIYLLAAAVLAGMLFDNAWSVHERIGSASVALVAPSAEPGTSQYVWAFQIGEQIAFLIMGLSVLAAMFLCLSRGDRGDNVRVIAVLLFIVPIAGFGVVLDFFKATMHVEALGMIENAAEMILLAAMAMVAVALASGARSKHGVPGRSP